MRIKTTALALVLLSAMALFLLVRTPQGKLLGGKPRVITTLYPWAYITSEIGGVNIEVVNLVPPGVEPHEYEPTPRDLARISRSQLIIINGAHLESWSDRIDSLSTTPKLVLSEKMSQLRQLRSSNLTDPHFWLDPVLVEEAVEQITTSLVQIDPTKKELYRENAHDLQVRLRQLHTDFSQSLQHCLKHDIVTSHWAFGYLASRYRFNQIAIAGLSPDEEPTPQAIAQLSQLVKSKKIKYIFFETLTSPKLAETLSSEAGITTLPLNPLEGLTREESVRGENYFSLQKQNLQNLKTALECS